MMMESIKIRYSKRNLIAGFLLGAFFLAIAIMRLLVSLKWYHLVFLLIGLVYLINAIYKSFNPYIEITDTEISIYKLIKKRIRIKDLIRVEYLYMGNEYQFETDKNEYYIFKKNIDKRDLELFENAFKEIQMQVNNQKKIG